MSFLVNLKLSLAQEMEISLEIEKSTPRQLTFSLIPSGRLITPEPEKNEVTDVLNQTPPEESVLLHPVFAMLAYRQPIRLNVSVLNASRHVGGAQRLAILLERPVSTSLGKCHTQRGLRRAAPCRRAPAARPPPRARR